jgi:hypothetical protein
MHNFSNQEVGQMPQRPTKLVVEPLAAGVGRNLGSQAGQKTTQRLLALWRSRAKRSLSWSMTPSMS